MIGTQLTQTYRVECDYCGQPTAWQRTIEEARAAAAERGYQVSRWSSPAGCPCELVLCPGCWAEGRAAADPKGGSSHG